MPAFVVEAHKHYFAHRRRHLARRSGDNTASAVWTAKSDTHGFCLPVQDKESAPGLNPSRLLLLFTAATSVLCGILFQACEVDNPGHRCGTSLVTVGKLFQGVDFLGAH
jgi:hypothetical protein